MPKNNDEIGGWTTSASISSTLFSLFRRRPDDPVGNFRSFAFPAIIRFIWIALSWMQIIGGVVSIIGGGIAAVHKGQTEYTDAKIRLEGEVDSFAQSVATQSANILNRTGVISFLEGVPLNDRQLLALREEIQANLKIQDIMFSDESVQSLMGTESFEFKSEIRRNVWRAEIDKHQFTFFKRTLNAHDNKRWIVVAWKDLPPTGGAYDPTITYLMAALIYSLLTILFTIVGLLLTRLVCEAAILIFRFVDEIVAIHETLKKNGIPGDTSDET